MDTKTVTSGTSRTTTKQTSRNRTPHIHIVIGGGAMRTLSQACWIVGLVCQSNTRFGFGGIANNHRFQRSTFVGSLASAASDANDIPPGRVPDRDEWIRWCSTSLQKATGKTLYEEIADPAVQSPADIHNNERYSVLSHGTQDDPIYNYFNRAALLTFQYPESEIYSLPSRYSAPPGSTREQREKLMKGIVEVGVQRFPTAVRQTKSGHLFQLTDVLLWNIYDDEGNRVGQTALFDREKIQPVIAAAAGSISSET